VRRNTSRRKGSRFFQNLILVWSCSGSRRFCVEPPKTPRSPGVERVRREVHVELSSIHSSSCGAARLAAGRLIGADRRASFSPTRPARGTADTPCQRSPWSVFPARPRLQPMRRRAHRTSARHRAQRRHPRARIQVKNPVAGSRIVTLISLPSFITPIGK
jgi:hypothetical protein